ncbi:pentapeptide repeat protein [Falsibacillus pallidus]|uniref:Pentapeptide repeat protein n=1 Tax=Falsibacillus pallidus TaxID=493781 RepID=A0A370GPQ0_9BACI|nr:pentapeptide repeat protein [Falsibacillus pallidus]
MGKNLKTSDFRGANFRGAYLIAADLRDSDFRMAEMIGADMRDADVRGADFSNSLFLTQVQINAAKGDSKTKLPPGIKHPLHWS